MFQTNSDHCKLNLIKSNIQTHSQKGFLDMLKNNIIHNYQEECSIQVPNCYVSSTVLGFSLEISKHYYGFV